MFEGIRLTTLDRGPGHWPGTAMPGELGNVVVAGHRVSHNEDFRNLDQLVPGDEVIFNTATGRHTYHVAEHRGRRAGGGLDRRPDPCPDRDPVRVPSSGIDSPAHRRASRTRSLSRFALALGSGFLVALSLPPWGWWPLAFVGVALFEVSLGRDTGRLMRFGLGTTFGFAWMSMGMGWMWHLTVPGYLIASCLFGVYHGLAELASPTGRWRIIGRPAAHTLVEAVRFSFPAGGVPLASLGISQAAGPLAELARVGGVILITWVVFQVGFTLGALLERDARSLVPALGGLVTAVVVLAVSFVAPSGRDTGADLDVAAVQGGGEQGTSALDVPSEIVTARHLEATNTIEAGDGLDLVRVAGERHRHRRLRHEHRTGGGRGRSAATRRAVRRRRDRGRRRTSRAGSPTPRSSSRRTAP